MKPLKAYKLECLLGWLEKASIVRPELSTLLSVESQCRFKEMTVNELETVLTLVSGVYSAGWADAKDRRNRNRKAA